MHGEFGADIGHVIRESLAPGHRADIDDRTVLALDHAGHHRVHAVEQALHIHIEHLVPLGRVLFAHLAQQHHPGVVDQGIGRAELCFGLGNGGEQDGTVGDVDTTAEAVGQRQGFQALDAPGQQ
ncbi:hypothetical protein D3C76_1601630 [compost metagenome]